MHQQLTLNSFKTVSSNRPLAFTPDVGDKDVDFPSLLHNNELQSVEGKKKKKKSEVNSFECPWSCFSSVKNSHVHINILVHFYLFLKELYIHIPASVYGVTYLYKFAVKFIPFSTWKVKCF